MFKCRKGTVLERTSSTVGNVEDIIEEDPWGRSYNSFTAHIGPKTEVEDQQSAVFQGEHTAALQVALVDSTKMGTQKVITALDQLTSGISLVLNSLFHRKHPH